MDESIELYPGLVFNYPKEPPKYKIAGHTLVKKSQKWTRVETPDNFDELSEKEQYDHAMLINKYCSEGYWFYNNGIPTYITGDNFHYLNEFKLDIGYPEYRDVDRRWFYAWEICEKDDNSIGMDYAKKRRDGFSYRAASIILNNARKTANSHYGIVSKTGIDAQECFSKVVYAFKEYNSFLKPQVHSAEDVKKELYFQTPIQKITHKTRKVEKEISLNTKISWKNTKDNSYDGFKLKRILIDEAGKMEEANFNKLFNIIKTCLLVGGRLIGKALVGSTVNESNKGGKAFKEIWDLSNPLEKNENNRTTSGLYRYFVPAYDGLEGFVDEYGQSVIEDPTEEIYDKEGILIKQGAKSYLTKERNGKRKAGDIVGFYEQMRQFPFDEDEMFRDAANEKTTFDLDRIYEQIDHNQVSVAMNKVLVRGNFEWKDGIRDTTVEWKPTESGRWLICWLPPVEERNKVKHVYGSKTPGNTHIGCFGLDPFSAKDTIGTKQSKAASLGFRKFDVMDEKSNCFVSLYWGRPKDPLIVYEDMILQSVFYGWELLVENNKSNCLDYFRLRGYEGYLMDRPSFTHTESSKNQKEKGLPNAGEGLRQQLMETYENYISNNIGINQETGKIGFCPFDDVLHDAIAFDPNEWGKYDITVAAMITLIGSKKYVQVIKPVVKMNLFQQYKIVGNTSKKI